MAEYTTLARPYAVAAYKRAKETNNVARWAEQLGFLKDVMADGDIQRAAANPKARREDFTTAFLDLCQGRLDPEVESFVRLLIRNHRLGLIRYIAEQFGAHQAEDEGFIDVRVTSAFTLTDEQWVQLESMLQRKLNKKPRLSVFIDNDLIGGVFIRAGDRVIDASVRGQIERLAKSLWN